MKTQKSTPETDEVLQKARFLASKMWEHWNRSETEKTAEEETFQDFKAYCIKHNIDLKEAYKILIAVGYSETTAKIYKSRMKIVNDNEGVAAGVASGETTFNEGYKKAKIQRAKYAPRTQKAMNTRYQTETVRAIRTAKELSKTKQEHLDFVASNWDIKP